MAIEIIEESLALHRTVLLVRDRKVLERVPLQIPVPDPEKVAEQLRRLIAEESNLLKQAAEKYPERPSEG